LIIYKARQEFINPPIQFLSARWDARKIFDLGLELFQSGLIRTRFVRFIE
jgi:hypothetical protein